MSVLTSILALIVTLGILVTVHEYGHYWVARRCGVKVLRFSVGFGQVLWSRTDKHGTEFAIAAIPLGGYVKMLDEREASVPEELLDQAFNRKTVWQRMAVVLAGPAANILFAIAAYWLMFMVGVTQVKPIIGDVEVDSAAELGGIKAGDEITAVNGEAVAGWQEVNYQLLTRIGDTGQLVFQLNGNREAEVEVVRWLSDAEEPNPVRDLGLSPYRPEVPAIIQQVQEGKPAAQAGLQAGDQIVSVDGESIAEWYDFVERVQKNADTLIRIEYLRDGETQALDLIPGSRTLDNGETVGFVGAMVKAPELPDSYITTQRFNPVEALWKGVVKTWDMSIVTLESIGKMIQGLLSVKNLSGPITIAKVANASAEAGFEAFIGFLAYISIMLAVVNLLPIPVLDGGHFLFYLIEAVKGSPLSEKVQLMGMKLGMTLLFMVMFIAIFNDISRI